MQSIEPGIHFTESQLAMPGYRSTAPVFLRAPGSRLARPGMTRKHIEHAVQWIPGLRQVAHPGMTTERVAAQRHDGQDSASHGPQISGLSLAVSRPLRGARRAA